MSLKLRLEEQDLVTFRDPETSSLKTSFQEKISLRTATGSSHLQPLAKVDRVQALQNRPMKKPDLMVRLFHWYTRQDLNLRPLAPQANALSS
jgi:hypothetical protein